MRLKINISPCPNDTFMFEAMLNGRIDCEGLCFDVNYLDIEQLNKGVLEDKSLQISKISYAILPLIKENYNVLDSGSALGFGNGPLLVSHKKDLKITRETKIVTPGKHTTANLLMKKIFPQISEPSYALFSDIASLVESEKYDAGVLIHEGRFTYHKKNLHLVADLGVKWEELTHLPLPLGAIVVNKNLSFDIQQKINRVLKRSILFAFENPEVSRDFIKKHAQELDDDVIDSHIEMFVNDFSVSLSGQGRGAVKALCDINDENIFVQ